MSTQIIEKVEGISDDVLMAMLHFSPDAKESRGADLGGRHGKWVTTQYDCRPFMPQNPLILDDTFSEGRLFSDYAGYLMADPSEQFDRFEILIPQAGGSSYKWVAQRLRRTRPRAFIRPGCDVFWDFCQRTVYPSGREVVQVGVFGWNKAKKIALSCPVPEHKPSVIQGRERKLEEEMRSTLILSASIVEDMKANWSVTVREQSAFTLYSTEDKIKELCDLRDAPLTDSGRRAAICHWVRAHRRKANPEPVDVRRHLRGVTQFPLGTMQITVTPPVGFKIS